VAWQERQLAPPAGILQATGDYRRDMDVLEDFLDDCCVAGRSISSGGAGLTRCASNPAAAVAPMSDRLPMPVSATRRTAAPHGSEAEDLGQLDATHARHVQIGESNLGPEIS